MLNSKETVFVDAKQMCGFKLMRLYLKITCDRELLINNYEFKYDVHGIT